MQNNNEAVEVPLDGAPEANQIQEVLPLELSTSTEMVRGDVNLKRFGNVIFLHYRTKDLDKARNSRTTPLNHGFQ